MTIAGIILAGGLARRMGGGDKAMLSLSGRPLLAHVIDRLAPQVAEIALNANVLYEFAICRRFDLGNRLVQSD